MPNKLPIPIQRRILKLEQRILELQRRVFQLEQQNAELKHENKELKAEKTKPRPITAEERARRLAFVMERRKVNAKS